MYNKVILQGRLVKDPEEKIAGETRIAKFTIATDSGYGDKKKSEFTDCVAFGKTAEIVAKYVPKGNLLLVEGRLQTSNWEHEGKKYYKTEVIVEKAVLQPKGDQKKEIPVIDDDTVEISDLKF